MPDKVPDPMHQISLREGKFNHSDAHDLEGLFSAFSTTPGQCLVVHFHGGLTDYASGLSNARDFHPNYAEAGVYPVFFLWESGPWDVAPAAFTQVFGEVVFQELLKRLVGLAQAKLLSGENRDPLEANLPSTREVEREFDRGNRGPFTTEAYPQSRGNHLTPKDQLSEADKQDIESILEQDRELKRLFEDLKARTQDDRLRGRPSTLMKPKYLDTTPVAGERGWLLPWIVGAVRVLVSVIDRFIRRRDHGLHATVVEEILREFYLDDLGKEAWRIMKSYTQLAFGDDPECGGTAFLQGLKAQLQRHPDLRVVLVGHSAGTIFICSFLDKAAEIIPEAKFEVIFFAAAVDYGRFAEALSKHQSRMVGFRSFGMSDDLEKQDVLLKGFLPEGLDHIYPYSLLYFVSGVCEPEVDTPIVGMQRFAQAPFGTEVSPALVSTVQAYLACPGSDRMFWSVVDCGEGKAADGTSHGGFPFSSKTLQSLKFILRTPRWFEVGHA